MAPAINADGLTRDEIIKEYFYLGMNYVERLRFLVNFHGIHIGLRQIKRILKKLGCRRRGVRSNFDNTVRVMEIELKVPMTPKFLLHDVKEYLKL